MFHWNVSKDNKINFTKLIWNLIFLLLFNEPCAAASFNAKTDFNVIGNPNPPYDTANLQKALDSAAGGSLYIPAGTYYIQGPLIINPYKSVKIYGDGCGPNDGISFSGTILKIVGNGDCLNICNDADSATSNILNQISISDLMIDGSNTANNGITMKYIHAARLNNVWVTTCYGHGILMQNCWGSSLTNVTSTHNGAMGVYLAGKNNNVMLHKCVFNTNSQRGGFANIYLAGPINSENLGIVIQGCDCSYSGKTDSASMPNSIGLVCQYSRGISITGCYFENNSTSNIYSDSTSQGMVITGCYFQNSNSLFDNTDALIYEGNFHIVQDAGNTCNVTIRGSNIRIGPNIWQSGASLK